MPLIDSSFRGDERLHHVPRGDPARVTVVVSNSTCALSATELASIESEKTRQKLKVKSDQVEIFHRKLVGRLAKERAADACARYTKASTQLGSINSFSELGAVLESTGPTIGEEQGAPREHALSSNETPCYQAVKVIGVREDTNSLLDADADARMALAAYRK